MSHAFFIWGAYGVAFAALARLRAPRSIWRRRLVWIWGHLTMRVLTATSTSAQARARGKE